MLIFQCTPYFRQNDEDVQNIVTSSLMSRNRFDEIMQNLHLENSSTLDPDDKLSNERLLIEKLNKLWLLEYLPEQTVSIDESMVPYF